MVQDGPHHCPAPAPIETAAPDTTTSAAVGSGKKNSNREQPTKGPASTTILAANTNSDVTSTDNSGDSTSDLDYVELCKSSPTSSASTPELEGHVHELQHMHRVATVDLEEFTQPTELFTQPNELNPTEIADGETTPAETLRQ